VVGIPLPTTRGMLRTFTARGVAALAIAVAAIAPGSPSAAHTQRPDAVLRQLVDAVGRWDIDGICARVSVAELSGLDDDLDFVEPESQCVLILEGGHDAKEVLQDEFEDLASLRTVAVRVRGKRAQVTYDYEVRDAGLTARGTARLIFERGGWKVDNPEDGPPRVGREYLFQVPSDSMEPAIPIGTWILVDPRPYRAHTPAVGDVVVLRPPAGFDSAKPGEACGAPRPKGQACARAKRDVADTYVVKRVVALPGDRVAIRHGGVVRNGVRDRFGSTKWCSAGVGCDFPRPFTVPSRRYYVMGDNRGMSDDSRFWGPVPKSSILGRARIIKR
jgi:signal peptidase I